MPKEMVYLSFHNTILEFVLYETLLNALADYKQKIEISIEIIPINQFLNRFEQVKKPLIQTLE